MNVNCNVTKVQTGYDRKTCWVQTRAGIIPDCKKIVITTQKLRLTGSDIFYGICTIISDDIERYGADNTIFRFFVYYCGCFSNPVGMTEYSSGC